MPHADPHAHAAPAHDVPSDDATNPAIKDAALTLWVVVGAIAAWSAAVYFFIL